MITLLHPCVTTSGVLCLILGSTAQEGPGAAAEGPGGHRAEEGAEASPPRQAVQQQRGSEPGSTKQLGFVVEVLLCHPLVWSSSRCHGSGSTDEADRSRAAASLSHTGNRCLSQTRPNKGSSQQGPALIQPTHPGSSSTARPG